MPHTPGPAPAPVSHPRCAPMSGYALPRGVVEGVKEVLALHTDAELGLLCDVLGVAPAPGNARSAPAADVGEAGRDRGALVAAVAASSWLQTEDGVQRMLGRVLVSVLREYMRRKGLFLPQVGRDRPAARVVWEHWTGAVPATDSNRAYHRFVATLPEFRARKSREMRQQELLRRVEAGEGLDLGPPVLQSLPPLSWDPVSPAVGGGGRGAVRRQLDRVAGDAGDNESWPALVAPPDDGDAAAPAWADAEALRQAPHDPSVSQRVIEAGEREVAELEAAFRDTERRMKTAPAAGTAKRFYSQLSSMRLADRRARERCAEALRAVHGQLLREVAAHAEARGHLERATGLVAAQQDAARRRREEAERLREELGRERGVQRRTEEELARTEEELARTKAELAASRAREEALRTDLGHTRAAWETAEAARAEALRRGEEDGARIAELEAAEADARGREAALGEQRRFLAERGGLAAAELEQVWRLRQAEQAQWAACDQERERLGMALEATEARYTVLWRAANPQRGRRGRGRGQGRGRSPPGKTPRGRGRK